MSEDECSICDKHINEPQNGTWMWDEEPAHMECVLKKATHTCPSCGHMCLETSEDDCFNCGCKLAPLTDKIKEEIRNNEFYAK